ncbi:MAG: DUF523 and DUF1722 domain-containing protein [Kiritimatiellae bacterium]|nr:DUF523 and DUF1722 domain-containing protein [Kiritimatiellia bacterium]
MKKIKIGISTCLTGEKVRYDGQAQRDSFLMDKLGKFVEYTPVCPESECGLSTPREAMRLVGDVTNPQLITVKTGQDITPQMKRWIAPRLKALAREELCGFIFKSKSPSSGLYRVKVYQGPGVAPIKQGTGIFAAAYVKRFPDTPVEEEGRLNDPALRECFIDKVCAFARLQELCAQPRLKMKALTDFHAAFKYNIMAHNPAAVSRLGRLLAAPSTNVKAVAATYCSELMQALSTPATRKKHTNALQHISGYFKKDLTAIEKEELHRIIAGYYDELYPLLAPLVLLRHYAVIYENSYLLGQYYLNPDPLQLNCRF